MRSPDDAHVERVALLGQLEMKQPRHYPGIAADVSAALRRRRLDRLVVQSFDHAAAHTLSVLEPTVSVGLLGHPPVRRLPRPGEWARQVNPHHLRTTRACVDAVHAAGMECLAWTVDRSGDMTRALGLGVDGIITNRPDRLYRLFSSRSLTGT